jgi:RecA/RadA recombinase
MSLLIERLQAAAAIKSTVLSESTLYKDKDVIPTGVPMINVALSGRLDGGLTSGLTILAGPSKHFKTAFGILLMGAFLKKHKDSICLFYDSEFGTPEKYFDAFGVNTERVLHTPVMDIEELKFDIMKKMKEIGKKDKVFIFIDSIGNLASKKEVDDALNEKSVADMTRAKQIKSLFRMVTPYLTTKDIPLVAVNHTYQTQEMFSRPVVSGGTGVMYSADNVWIIGRSQEKTGKELNGYSFNINIEKSRFVREKSKIPIVVTFEGGINKWSGLLDVAVISGHVIKPKVGWYTRPSVDGDKNWRAAETNRKEFWLPILEETDFPKWVQERYTLGMTEMVQEEDE